MRAYISVVETCACPKKSELSDFLGHVEVATTEVYARCDQEAIRKAIEESNGIAIEVEIRQSESAEIA